jgi:eukaryotic-like serine/threonine-protein kinase
LTQFRLTLPSSGRGAADGSLSLGLSITITRRVAISRDGRFIVYNAEEDGVSRLYLHRLDQLDPIAIRGAEGPVTEVGSVLLSPDGQWVAYHDTRGLLKKLPITGGTPSTIYEAGPDGFIVPATWGGDGTIVFSSQKTRGLMRVSENGGEASVLTRAQGETHYQPQLIPGGVVIFTIDKDGRRPTVAALSLESGKYKPLVEGFAPRATADGHLLFMRDGGIWAARFDRRTLTLTSPPSLVVAGLEWSANFDVADNGTLVYTPTQSRRRIVWVDRQGREEFIPIPAQTYINPRISPDGNRVILDVRDFRDEGDIWILDLRRGNLDKLTTIPGNKRHAIWTRDGKHIAFSQVDGPRFLDGPTTRARTGTANVYLQRADGIGTPERLLESNLLQYPVSFTADGTRVVLREMGVGHGANWNLRIMSLRDRKMAPLLAGNSYETNGEISPDGRWIAYESEESSRREVWVRPFPDVQSARWRISTNGGREPLWSRNGREVFYLGLDGRLMKVDVATAPSFNVSTPVRLLNNVYLFRSVSATPGRSYDISPDGSRFLMIKEPVSGNELVVSLNWTSTLDK